MQLGIRSVASLLALVFSLPGAAAAEVAAGTFASVGGDVELRRAGAEPQRPTVGSPLLVKDELRVGDSGRVRILMGDGVLIDVGSASNVIVQEDGGAAATDRTTLTLNEGTLRAQVRQPARPAPSLEIETPTALVRSKDGDIIVDHQAGDGGTDVLCVSGRAQVQGTLGVIGKGVDLVAGRATRVPSGGLPSAARDIEAENLATYQGRVEVIGTGSDDHLDAGHPLVAGHLMEANDRPSLPPTAQAAATGSHLWIGPPGETLIEQLSPDLRTNTQPIPEYEFAEPGIQPPPVDD